MHLPDFKYRNRRDKAIMFFTGSSKGDTDTLLRSGIYDILVSYHYIRKNPRYFQEELLPEIERNGGYFMTDSGAFSFFSKYADNPAYSKEEAWLPYLNEYVEWVDTWAKHIYVTANLDLEAIVGRDVVDRWNHKYFVPLDKKTQICYVAHQDKELGDPYGTGRLEQYLQQFNYVGINQSLKDHAAKLYTLVTNYKKRCHGFAWTQLPLLCQYPLFSVDSTTWLGGPKYGTTYHYDGHNFRVINYKKKYVRQTKAVELDKGGMFSYDEVKDEKRNAVNYLNLEGWKGARYEFLKHANMKLKTQVVPAYVRTR